MHISEGILAPPVLMAGAALAVGGLAVGLKKMEAEKVPAVALLAAAFFVASLIHVPLGPASVHLVLNGLCGLLLGWMAFPALLVGLAMQAVFFQFGGLTTLGVNTFTMAFPAVLVHYLCRPLVSRSGRLAPFAGGFLAGALALLFSGMLLASSLVLTGEPFFTIAQFTVVAYLPLMLVEGVLTGFCVLFLGKVKPDLLAGVHFHASSRS